MQEGQHFTTGLIWHLAKKQKSPILSGGKPDCKHSKYQADRAVGLCEAQGCPPHCAGLGKFGLLVEIAGGLYDSSDANMQR